jgi:hypothetical protein
MPRLSQVGPGRLEVREGGGVLAVFGLPFLIIGLGIMVAILGGMPMQDADTAPWFARPLMWLMGLVFACVGGGLVFGRTWTTFDANARTIVTQMGLLAPMSRTAHRIDDYTNIVLGFQHGDSDSADQFSISLKARSGSDLAKRDHRRRWQGRHGHSAQTGASGAVSRLSDTRGRSDLFRRAVLPFLPAIEYA